MLHELHQPVLHEERREVIHEEVRKPEFDEKTEKTIFTQEIRPPIIEKNVEKPIVSEEKGTLEVIRCDKAGCSDETHLHSDEKLGFGSKIKEVFNDIKHSIKGDKKE